MRHYLIIAGAALAALTLPGRAAASGPALTLLQPGNAASVRDCNGLRFKLTDQIIAIGAGTATYTLVRDGTDVDSVVKTIPGLFTIHVAVEFVSAPIAGSYSVRRSPPIRNWSPGTIAVRFQPGFTCQNRPVQSFGGEIWFHGQSAASRPVVGDFDNDGFEDDIAYYGLCGTPGQACIRVHRGSGSASSATSFGGSLWFFTEGPVGAPVSGDLDGDGFRDDIVYLGRCGTGFPCWRAHFSNGSAFSTEQLGWDMWLGDDSPNSVPLVGDFDNDGKVDDIIYSGRCGNGQSCWRAHMGN